MPALHAVDPRSLVLSDVEIAWGNPPATISGARVAAALACLGVHGSDWDDVEAVAGVIEGLGLAVGVLARQGQALAVDPGDLARALSALGAVIAAHAARLLAGERAAVLATAVVRPAGEKAGR